MGGDLKMAASQLQTALALPSLNPIQRARISALLEEVPGWHAVYADDAHPVTECSTIAPSTLHGLMHVARELMFQSDFHGPLAILRPTLIYGAADPHNGYGPNRFRRLADRRLEETARVEDRVAPVPEPSYLGLMSLVVLALVVLLRGRRASNV